MKKSIYVIIRQVYGIDKIYPACDQSTLLAKLAGTTTLTESAISLIKQLNYEIVVTQTIVTL